VQLTQWRTFEKDHPFPARLFLAYQPGTLKNPQVLANSLHCHPVGKGQLGDCRVAKGEALENRAAGGVGERKEYVVELAAHNCKPIG